MVNINMSILDWVAFTIAILGGLNQGMSVTAFNMVEILFGTWAKIAYGVIAVASAYAVISLSMKITRLAYSTG